MRTSFPVGVALLTGVALLFGGCSKERRTARLLERANAFYSTGELEKARISYLNVLQQDPKNAVAAERLALIWIDQGSPLRAFPFLLQAKIRSPEKLELRFKLAEISVAMGKLEEASKEAREILRRSSRVPQALVLLSEVVRDRKSYEVAEQELERFLDRQSVSYQLATANLCLRRGDEIAAKTAFQRALTLDPKSVAAHLAMGGFHAWQENKPKAIEEYKKAADLAPVRSVARIRYADYLAAGGSTPEARKYLKELTDQAPDFLSAWCALARVTLAEKKYDEALGIVKKVFDRDPVNYDARALQAQILLAMGKTTESVEQLEKLAADFPGLASARQLLAIGHLQNKEVPKAIEALKAALVQNPDLDDALLLLARIQLGSGDAQSAATAMVELLGKRPNVAAAQSLFFDALRALNRLDHAERAFREQLKARPENAELHHLLGVVLNQQKKTEEARASFEKALALAPNRAQTVSDLISLDLNEGKFDQAMKRAQQLLEKAPDLALSHFIVARVHATQARWRDAEAAVIKTIERNPNFANAHGLLVESYVAQGKDPAAIARMEAFVAKHQGDLRAQIMAGEVHTRLNDFGKARDAYEKCLTVKPDATIVLNNLAVLYSERLNQADRALELARKARQLEPRSPAVADTLGWILIKRQEFAEAHALLKDAAEKVPDNPEIQYHYGVASQKVGQIEAARAAFEKAAAAKGDFAGKDELKQRLSQLDQGTANSVNRE